MTTGMEELEEVLDPAIPIPEDVEPQLVDVLPRGYLSVSQMVMLLKCPKSWYLRYVENRKPRTNIRPFQGIQVHRVVEKMMNQRLFKGTVPSLEDSMDAFSDEFETQKPLIDDWDGDDPGKSKDVGLKCTKAFYQEALPAATPVMVEKTFHTLIKTSSGKMQLPVLGRIDSIQVQSFTEQEYQDIRENVSASFTKQAAAEKPLVLPKVVKPLRIHDLKVTTDKWSENDLINDLQFAIYAGVEHIPDVQVDQVVKGRAKEPRPRYERLVGVMTNKQAQHAVQVAEGVAFTIGLGHFPPTDPSNWWCTEKFCSMWQFCRGKK